MQVSLNQRLGNYSLIRLLGEGGFARVYLGEHIHLKSLAAIKVLSAPQAQDFTLAFLSEAQTLVGLVHPHIVRLLDYGVEGRTPFFVMDYAPGGTLRDLYPKGCRVPRRDVSRYVMQVADALHYAHENGLIHRDVKPENILIGTGNDVLLGDFGIALALQRGHTVPGQQIAGTIAYMAPEQILSRPCQASDQYALGVVAYEWLCGEQPFRGTFHEVASHHCHLPPASLCEKLPGLSPRVERVIMRALSKTPEQRFPSVRDFACALEEAILSVPSLTSDTAQIGPPSQEALSPTVPCAFYTVHRRVVRSLPSSPQVGREGGGLSRLDPLFKWGKRHPLGWPLLTGIFIGYLSSGALLGVQFCMSSAFANGSISASLLDSFHPLLAFAFLSIALSSLILAGCIARRGSEKGWTAGMSGFTAALIQLEAANLFGHIIFAIATPFPFELLLWAVWAACGAAFGSCFSSPARDEGARIH